MPPLFDRLTQRLGQARGRLPPATGGRVYRCVCHRPVFFRNSRCLGCDTALGYECTLHRVIPVEPAEVDGEWRQASAPKDPSRIAPPQADAALLLGGAEPPAAVEPPAPAPDAAMARRYRHCGNFDSVAGCNWLVAVDPATGEAQPLCVACTLNRTIPDLTVDENRELWRRIEVAKRRLVSQLLSLGLPVTARGGPHPCPGLQFDFLRAAPGAPRVTTGHLDGLVTLDIEEADDVRREQQRTLLREPYRTLLGHFRHEVGHYYWDRLVQGTCWQEPFRELFGDERADYAAALRSNYECGPCADWQLFHVSGYASSHPWEDWAETWAQYLHMIDVVDTALSFGLDTAHVEIETEPFDAGALWRTEVPDATDFLHFLNTWVQLTHMLNEMSRSMGQPDFYPFVLPRAAVAKLQLIHMVVGDAPCPVAPPEPAPVPSGAVPLAA